MAAAPPSRGFAVQARLNAETVRPDGSVVAGSGRLTSFLPPGGRGVRVDTHGYPGYAVSPRYDSLLAKVIASGNTLDEALTRLGRALDEFDAQGVPTNRDLLIEIITEPALRDGRLDTGYVDAHLPDLAGISSPAAPGHGISDHGGDNPHGWEEPPADAVALRAPMPGVVVEILVVPGTAAVGGVPVAVMSYDYTVLAGTQGAKNHLKTDRFLRVAARSRLPVIVFGEGGGGRGGDTDGVGIGPLDCETFWLLSRLTGVVPLIGVVSGFCFAGNAAKLTVPQVTVVLRKAYGLGAMAMRAASCARRC